MCSTQMADIEIDGKIMTELLTRSELLTAINALNVTRAKTQLTTTRLFDIVFMCISFSRISTT